MSDTLAREPLAVLGKAFGDQLRLGILRVLSTESLGVLELSDVFEMRQPAMSHHLKVLLQAELVTTRKEGNSVFYRRALPPAGGMTEAIVRSLFVAVDSTPLSDTVATRLKRIQKQRAEQSRQFFARHAEVFRTHQEMIADHELYAAGVAEVIRQASFPGHSKALEIGPGEGAFLKALSECFDAVYAVDNCDDMLTCSKSRVAKEKLPNIQFLLGEIEQLSEMAGQFDCIVANMVLHHVPSPAGIFSQAGKLLKPGGSFLISELCRHDQEWVKTSCGDLWLGFGSDELSLWAKSAGFVDGDAQYLGLRNGFQIQIRRFTRPE